MNKKLHLRSLILLCNACLGILIAGCGKESLQPSVSAQPSKTIATNTPVIFPTLSAVIPLVPNQTDKPFIRPPMPVMPLSDIPGDTTTPETRILIASRLAVIWLDSYTRKDLPDRIRLQEYRIRDVEIFKGPLECLPGVHQDEFRIEIELDAKIVDYLYNPWFAGSGNFDFDSMWIVGKTLNPIVFREGNTYTWDWDWSCQSSYP